MSEGLSDRELTRIEKENTDAEWRIRTMGMSEVRIPDHLDEAVENVNLLLAEIRRLKTLEGKRS